MNDEEKIRRAMGGRLRTVRMAAGFTSARSAALAADWAESTYRAHENGSRTIDPMDASRYVLFFLRHGANKGGQNFTPRWVIYGDEDDVKSISLDDMVRGETAAFKKAAIDAILSLKKR